MFSDVTTQLGPKPPRFRLLDNIQLDIHTHKHTHTHTHP